MPKKSGCSEPSSKCVSKGAAERWLNVDYKLSGVSGYSSNQLIPVRSWRNAFQDLTNIYANIEGTAQMKYGAEVIFSTKEGKRAQYILSYDGSSLRYYRGDTKMNSSDKITYVSAVIKGVINIDPYAPTRVKMYSNFSSNIEYSNPLNGDGTDNVSYRASCSQGVDTHFIIYADLI